MRLVWGDEWVFVRTQIRIMSDTSTFQPGDIEEMLCRIEAASKRLGTTDHIWARNALNNIETSSDGRLDLEIAVKTCIGGTLAFLEGRLAYADGKGIDANTWRAAAMIDECYRHCVELWIQGWKTARVVAIARPGNSATILLPEILCSTKFDQQAQELRGRWPGFDDAFWLSFREFCHQAAKRELELDATGRFEFYGFTADSGPSIKFIGKSTGSGYVLDEIQM
jgi:hypothetical protein